MSRACEAEGEGSGKSNQETRGTLVRQRYKEDLGYKVERTRAFIFGDWDRDKETPL